MLLYLSLFPLLSLPFSFSSIQISSEYEFDYATTETLRVFL